MATQTKAATAKLPGRVICRAIKDEDIPAVVDLLARGYRCQRDFWQTAFSRIASIETLAGLPRYGYLLESSRAPVGVLLLIFSTGVEESPAAIRCNVSSWYVDPEYRPYAAMLASCALKHKQATYLNLTPAPGTVSILEAQGYKPLFSGKFVAIPILKRPFRGAEVVSVQGCTRGNFEISPKDLRILQRHAEFGCISLICCAPGGFYPFVFSLHRYAGIPFALLVYCRRIEEFVACGGALGRHLASRGFLSVVIHANGKIAGLPGLFLQTTPTFYFGIKPPALGNIAFSECAMFGVQPI